MNHVIIIDDEIQSRTGIAAIFENHSPKWFISGLFEDGDQVLQYLETHTDIQLIVTDIRMPKFNGLELISKIRKTNSTIPIIIISGYSEFSYAAKAVEFHVFRYVLKPVLPSEFDKIITSVENFLQLEKAPYKYNFKDSEYEQFLDLLFSESATQNKKETVTMLKRQCGFSFQNIWFLFLEGNSHFSNISASFRPQLKEFSTALSQDSHVFLFRQKLYCILIKKPDIDTDFLYKQLSKLLWSFPREAGVHASIYQSTFTDTFKNAFFSGISALKQYFYEKKSICLYADQGICTFPHMIYNNLQLQVDQNNLLDVRDSIYEFMDYIREKRPSYFELQSWVNKISLVIVKYCNDKNMSTACYIDYAESLEFLYNYYSLEEIEETLLSMIDSVFNKAFEQINSTHAYLIDQVQNYLTNHLNEKITLSDLADIFCINYTSLSNIYSSATGQTIIEYLTFLKISKAKELLINTDKKIYTISEELGYSDTKYFIKRFRKIVGITPKEFRKIYRIKG